MALLNDIGFPRRKLYELVQEIAEGYCLVTDKMLAKHQMGMSYSQVLFPQDKAEFETLKEIACKNDRLPKFHRGGRAKERAIHYKPWSPSKSDRINLQSIRYIGADDVDWFLEREMIIIPKDFETVEKLEKLEKTDGKKIWNIARSPKDIRHSNEFWQNILIVG